MPFRGQAGVVGTPTALVGEPPEFVGTLTALVGEGTGSGHLLAENKKPLSRVSFELE